MKTELFTVSRIFNESLFRVPDYQRGYSWQIPQLKDFWLDIEQLEDNKSHYTGVLTLEAVPEKTWQKWGDDKWIIESRRFSPFYVVDGQQRLTTIIIFIQCILEKPELPDRLNYTLVSDIRRKYIFDSRDDNMSRSYVFGYEKDNPSYEYLITNIFNELSKKHSTGEETIYTKNLREAKKFFADIVANMTVKEIEKLLQKITQQLVFNAYEISEEIDVFITFETMNNRGKPLSNLELLKNRLIYLATKICDDEESANLLRAEINAAWKTVYHYLGKNESRPLRDDTFLETHFNMYYFSVLDVIPDEEDKAHACIRAFLIAAETTGRFLLNDLFTQKRLRLKHEKWPDITPNFISEYAQNLKAAVTTYYKLSTPEDSSFSTDEKIGLDRIGRLRSHNPTPIILSAFLNEKSPKKRSDFLQTWERFLFLVSTRIPTAHFRTMNPFDLQPKFLSKKLNLSELTLHFEKSLLEMLKETSLSEILNDWFKNGMGYYGWRSIKYFLFEYEISLANTSRTSREKIDWSTYCGEDFRGDYDTVEHIYPQRARDPYWANNFGSFTATQKRALKNSVGNLLALSRPKNSSLSNKSFNLKKGNATSTVGFFTEGIQKTRLPNRRIGVQTKYSREALSFLIF